MKTRVTGCMQVQVLLAIGKVVADMLDLLFNPPWWMPTSILLVGTVLFWQANRTQDRGQRNAGLGILLVGLIFIATAWLINTPTETVVKQTRQLTQAVATRDWNTFERLLDPQVSFSAYGNKALLLAGAKLSAENIGLKSVSITGMETRRSGDLITSDIRCLSVQDRTMDQPVVTDWRFDWRDSEQGWRVYRIEPLQNANIGPQQIESHLAKVK